MTSGGTGTRQNAVEPALILQPAHEQFHIGPKQSERIDLALTAPSKERS